VVKSYRLIFNLKEFATLSPIPTSEPVVCYLGGGETLMKAEEKNI
jgi:hypothetical protein